ncbi:MAG: NAD-dependent succinate-semialdehyde dehydrogenase [Actinomycetota bacterium]|nr:NAD-dependent succinate-semialdehyde dehydrogenase [Actinomycetota bacterium]
MRSPRYQVTDPSTGAVMETFDDATDTELENMLAASATAYARWRDVPIAERAEVVKRIGALFGERAEELARIATQEMGKPASEGVEEAQFCQAIFEYFATEGPMLAADQPIKTFSGARAVVQKLPVGPLLGIMPWNFPYYQIARFAAPNLMLGNTIVLKHAESVPRSALAVEKIMVDAGVPTGVYQNVFASHSHIERIISDSRIQGVSLTGSERAGAIVAALAGQNLKKCVLELGGSDPMLVLDTDDLDKVAGKAWDFRMYNTGQACNSNKRMIVMDDLFDDFVAKLTQKALAVDTFSPMSSRAAAESLAAQVNDAVSKGATLHAGGVLGDGPAAFYSPAVLSGVTKDMRAYGEELFGPVAVVYKVGSDEEALALANDTQYGLGGSVFSTDAARAEKVANRLEVGMSNVNSTAAEGAEIPFGGVKRSGFGRELGPLGMDEFVNKRLFYIA